MDYKKIAEQHGGSIDYSALAKQAGGTVVGEQTPASQGTPQGGGIFTEPKKKGIFSALHSFGRTPGDFLKGQLKGVATTALSVGEIGSSALEFGYNKTIGKLTGKEAFKGSKMAEQAKDSKILERKNFAQKAGFMTEQIGEFFAPVPGGAKIKVAEQIGAKIPTAMKYAEKGVKIGSEALEMAGKETLQSGSTEDAGTAAKWALAGGVFGEVASGAFNKLGDAFYASLIPSTISQKAKDIGRELNIGEAVSQTGISLSRKQLINKIGEKVSAFGQRLDDAITVRKGEVSKTANEIFDGVENVLNKTDLGKKMQLSPIDIDDARIAIKEVLNKYRAKYGGRTLNAEELQAFKREVGKPLQKVFNQSLGTPIRAQALTETTLYRQLDNFLDKNIKNYQQLNEKLAPLLTAKKRFEKKGAYSGYLTDVIVGSMAGGTGGSIFRDPIGFMKNAMVGILVKRGVSSTLARTTAGTVFKNSSQMFESPQFWQIVRKAIQNSSSNESEE